MIHGCKPFVHKERYNMGDFSRLPQERALDSRSKHYVGVRMQQGVPLLDCDWNEMEDIQKQNAEEIFHQFIGDGVPDGNTGFLVEALPDGGIGTLVLTAVASGTGFSSITIDLAHSTAADILGFLPGHESARTWGASGARLTGYTTGPFTLSGATIAISVNGQEAETVSFTDGDATIDDIVDAINAGATRVTASQGDGNDFFIHGGSGDRSGAGRILVHGKMVWNEHDMVYSSQPLYMNDALASKWGVPRIEDLSPPSSGTRNDIVYIDTWEREVTTQEDDAIMLLPVGVETTVRMKREWAVRVAEGAVDLSGITPVEGHQYSIIASLNREAVDGDAISAESIIDRRVISLTMSKNIKSPISLSRGSESITAEEYANILMALKEILLERLQKRIFPFILSGAAFTYDMMLIFTSINDILNQCGQAALMARSGIMNNADALSFLSALYNLQNEFIQVVDEYGVGGDDTTQFITEYGWYLEGSAAQSIDGLKPSIDAGDLIGASEAQDQLNAWLSLPANVLPEGSVGVSILEVRPPDNVLTYNVPFVVEYNIVSNVDSPREQEQYAIVARTSAPSSWNLSLSNSIIELDSLNGSGSVELTVTPRTGTVSSQFRLTVHAVRNPTHVSFAHESELFSVGSLPPGEEFFQWIAPALQPDGRIPFSQSAFASGSVNFQLNVINTSESDQQTFTVQFHVIAPDGQEGQWHPDESEATPVAITLDAGDSRTDVYSIFGPTTPEIGSEGTVVATAQLTEVNGSPVVDGKTQSLELNFIINAG